MSRDHSAAVTTEVSLVISPTCENGLGCCTSNVRLIYYASDYGQAQPKDDESHRCGTNE
jgi:hypothetical protein